MVNSQKCYNTGMKDTNVLTYGRTSVYNLNYHVIWGTKYRNHVLKGNVEVVLKRVLQEIASKYGFSIDHMEIDKDDYIHLLISAPPKLSVTNIVRWLKGISAWRLFRECPELQRDYWKKADRHLWSSSYYVESIGTTNQAAVAKYIDDQRHQEVEIDDFEGR
nr:transposase family protein A [Lactiplantibacillus pentosus MP-10]